jgi:hypothetical protein
VLQRRLVSASLSFLCVVRVLICLGCRLDLDPGRDFYLARVFGRGLCCARDRLFSVSVSEFVDSVILTVAGSDLCSLVAGRCRDLCGLDRRCRLVASLST